MTEDYEHLADGGRISGLRAWRRSQGRDHIYQLDRFYGEGLISEVLSLVRIGKEASVYCCRAGAHLAGQHFSISALQQEPAPGEQDHGQGDPLTYSHSGSGRQADQPPGRLAPLVAAKVYRARQYRFKNDAVYQEQRTRGMKGQSVRALAKKTDFGRKVQTGSWVGHEFETMKVLYDAGCDVPRPIEMDADAILMEYIGDEDVAAPQLNRVRLDREEAEAQFERTMMNVEIALACHRVHGDLSAHNILFWDGRVVLIDFPQAVDARFNGQAERLLHRDVDNVCRYFAQFGVQADAWGLANDLWRRYTCAEL